MNREPNSVRGQALPRPWRPRAIRWTGGVALAALAVAAAMLVVAPSGGATPAAAREKARLLPQTSCASLMYQDLTYVHGATTTIISASNTKQDGVKLCDVTGYISPQTQFSVVLPEKTWTGGYLQEGCGGLCGVLVPSSLRTRVGFVQPVTPSVAEGHFIVATDNQGHLGATAYEAAWAKSDPALRVAFGYASENSLDQAVKAIAKIYYGREPSYSFFDGHSDGGHEALDLAQRYPRDCNGIIAGAPGDNWAPAIAMGIGWEIRANLSATGHEILDKAKLPALHAAVMRACADAQGVITDPRACTFNPASIECPTGVEDNNCLTSAQVQMVREEYRGAVDPKGRNLYDGGEPYGSELAWGGWFVDPAKDKAFPDDTLAWQLADGYLRYMAFWHNPAANRTLRAFRFTDASFRALQPLEGIYGATDPNLRQFRADGGKLILYHGWADQAISPETSIDYYRAMARFMGGFASAQKFSRLYMVPGLYHCFCGNPAGGDPKSPDFLHALIAWVEHGEAPGAVTASIDPQPGTRPSARPLMLDPTNPLLPPPHNTGLNSNYNYVGLRSTYRPNNQLWCKQQGLNLICSRRH